MSQRWNFERLTSLALTLAAIVVAAAVARREFLPPSAAQARAPVSPLPVKLASDRWDEMIATRIRIGAPTAPVQIVEFVDFECPACRHYHETVWPQVLTRFGPRVSLVLVHFPLEIHRFARVAALAVECADQQRATERFVGLVFAKQDSIGLKSWSSFAHEALVPDVARFTRCVESSPSTRRIDAGVGLAGSLGIRATPTVVVNGWQLGRTPDVSELSRIVRELLSGREPFAVVAGDRVDQGEPK